MSMFGDSNGEGCKKYIVYCIKSFLAFDLPPSRSQNSFNKEIGVLQPFLDFTHNMIWSLAKMLLSEILNI